MSGLTASDPAALGLVIASDNLRSGDTIELVAPVTGRYTLARPFAKLRGGTIDGSIVVNSAAGTIVLEDLEIYNSSIGNRTASMGYDAIEINGNSVTVRNCIIHDTREGIITGKAITIEDCVIYHNGWNAIDRGHGHGIYCSQQDTQRQITIRRCIIYANFGWGIHAYTDNAMVENVIVEDCISYCNGLPAQGRLNPNLLFGASGNFWPRGCQARRNVFYHIGNSTGDNLRLGGGTAGSQSCVIEDNLVVGGQNALYFVGDNWGQNTVSNNTIYGNVYNCSFFPDNDYRPYSVPDSVTVVQRSSSRLHVAVCNGSAAQTVSVDVGSYGLSGTVQIINVSDYQSDRWLAEVVDGQITIDMTARSTATPVGWTAIPSTYPQFGAFVITEV